MDRQVANPNEQTLQFCVSKYVAGELENALRIVSISYEDYR